MSTATQNVSWKMKHRPGSWRAPIPSPQIIHTTPGRQGPIFPFSDLPYDVQESVLRFLPIPDLVRARASSAAFIIVYEGVACTEFVALAGVPKPKFNRVSDEFQFLYRSRRLNHPVHVTPLLLWAAARNHHILIKNILAKALGQPVARARETNPTTEDDVNAVLLGLDQEDGIGGTGAKEQERRFELENNNNININGNLTEEIMAMNLLRGTNGITPLHVACRNDHLQSTMELIKAGGDVLARDHKLQTPFYHACALGQGPAINIVRTIIKHCYFLRTVVAARKERDSYDPSTAERIRDIDLNMVSNEGKTCLYAAAERGHPG